MKTRKQINEQVAKLGHPGLSLEKMGGIWYLLDTATNTVQYNDQAERCLHACTLEQITDATLAAKIEELTHE